jgi:hypoxanthine phosphoribosyltransferase
LSQPVPESVHDKYRALTKNMAVEMPVSEAEDLSRHLAHVISADGDRPDLIVGIANGALLPTKVVSETLGIPLKIVRVRRQGSRYKQMIVKVKNALGLKASWLSWGPMNYLRSRFEQRYNKLETETNTFAFDVRGLSVALVDDCIESGQSVRYVADALLKQGASRVTINVLCWTAGAPGDKPEMEPDVYLHRHIQVYPWAATHSDLKGYMKWLKDHGMEHWE